MSEAYQNSIMKRIAIIGSTGSGKSTLARRIANRTEAQHTELDSLHWLPGWIERDTADFLRLVDDVTARPSWVIDGGYSEARHLVWGRADTIVWLNYGFLRTAWQLLGRTYRRNALREPCCNGNYESWRLSFSKDSILLWLLKSYWRNRKTFPLALAQYGQGKTVHVLRSPKETEVWLNAKL
jgi:adenylate kinase family enzyme